MVLWILAIWCFCGIFLFITFQSGFNKNKCVKRVATHREGRPRVLAGQGE